MSPLLHPVRLIDRYYADAPLARQILLDHSRRVTQRALQIARFRHQFEPIDLRFVAEAAMLHDIGIIRTATPELGCHGEGPYLRHGIEGKAMLEAEGLPRHARVCARHIGIGLTAHEIVAQQLPLPAQDMCPETIEEQIICYADLFYSKNRKQRKQEKSPDRVRKTLRKYGEEKLAVFDRWRQLFEPGQN